MAVLTTFVRTVNTVLANKNNGILMKWIKKTDFFVLKTYVAYKIK